MPQLPADCLNEILEYLEDDKITLRSCLLVNHLWCETSVRILWRNYSNYSIQICSTLFACLPNESNDILHDDEIIISTQTLKPPLFNYAAFCRVLSTKHVNDMVGNMVEMRLISRIYRSISSQKLRNDIYVARQEIYKLFMNQTSIKRLELEFRINYDDLDNQKVIFTSYPGANNCLKNLSELSCNSNIYSEIFYQLSQICHTIQSLDISFNDVISNGLTDLISVQKNLKYLKMTQTRGDSIKDIIPSLTKLSNTLIKLIFNTDNCQYVSLSFISKFLNLQELELCNCFKNFEDVILPQLQILKIQFYYPIGKLLFKFLENNGKSLKEFYLIYKPEYSDNPLNLAVAKFCPNLRKLHTGFINNKPETFKIVFNSCQHLESIRFWCDGRWCLSDKEALEVIMKYSHEKLCEIILSYKYNFQYFQPKLLPKELESFLSSWKNSIPQRPSFSLIIVNYHDEHYGLDTIDENMKIIEKYAKLGVIKKFKVESSYR